MVVANPWVSWFNAASVPALIALLTTPLILYKVFLEDPLVAATEKLRKLGSVSKV